MQIRTLTLGFMLSLVTAVAAQDATQGQAKVESFSPQGQIRTCGRSSRAFRSQW